MLPSLRSSYTLIIFLFIAFSHSVFSMDNNSNQNKNEQQIPEEETLETRKERLKKELADLDEKIDNTKREQLLNDLKSLKKQAKVNNYIRDNQISYKIAGNIGDHAVKGFMEFCAKTASESILEVVKKELDIRYDKDPSVALELNEIATGITIINNAVTLTDDLCGKSLKEINALKIADEEKSKKKQALQEEIVLNYHDLRHLRNEHIDQLNRLRKKRNPNFVPFSKSN